ncbi:MAG: PASTA domain-containing protein [Lachnospiraceae bacterium]|nr:PASTA domain-containing protein [Lachnospiraceae bacterium]
MDVEKTEQEKIKQPKPLPKKEFIPDFGKEEKKSRKKMVAVITTVCVLAMSVGGGYYWYVTYSKNTGAIIQGEKEREVISYVEMSKVAKKVISYIESRCKVPDVVNMTEAEAKKGLKMLLTVEVKHTYSTSVEKGKIISQSIEAGTVVKKGKTIVLTISKGEKVVATPKPVIQEPAYVPSKPKVPAVTKKPQVPKEDDDIEVEVIAEE